MVIQIEQMEEWRYASRDNGEQFVTMHGTTGMLKLFVENLAMEL